MWLRHPCAYPTFIRKTPRPSTSAVASETRRDATHSASALSKDLRARDEYKMIGKQVNALMSKTAHPERTVSFACWRTERRKTWVRMQKPRSAAKRKQRGERGPKNTHGETGDRRTAAKSGAVKEYLCPVCRSQETAICERDSNILYGENFSKTKRKNP